MRQMLIPVSPGELLDKITILRIKMARLTEPSKLSNVSRELILLQEIWNREVPKESDLSEETAALMAANEKIFSAIDSIWGKELRRCFDSDFVAMARTIYVCNDERAAIKKSVNQKLGSTLAEEKSCGDLMGK